MTKNELKSLRRGDIVQNKASGHSYIIELDGEDMIIAISTRTVTNPIEWELIAKSRPVA